MVHCCLTLQTLLISRRFLVGPRQLLRGILRCPSWRKSSLAWCSSLARFRATLSSCPRFWLTARGWQGILNMQWRRIGRCFYEMKKPEGWPLSGGTVQLKITAVWLRRRPRLARSLKCCCWQSSKLNSERKQRYLRKQQQVRCRHSSKKS